MFEKRNIGLTTEPRLGIVGYVKNNFTESLILAQDERWRYA